MRMQFAKPKQREAKRTTLVKTTPHGIEYFEISYRDPKQAMRVAGRWAGTVGLDFSWYDAARMNAQIVEDCNR